MTGLQIADDFSLPVDVATSTMAILAKKRAGKSNAAVKIAEEMYAAGIPWVAVDPKGDWWGMRSSADGKSDGLPLIVFGGRHADVPLEPTAGIVVADLILANRLTCILDVSEFSKADATRFLTVFGDRLYRAATDEPMHVFLEEAHEYLPQRVMGDESRMVSVWQKLVKQGGFKGIGVTLISQRSASLNKDVLTQIDTLFVLRTTSPQDRAAVKAWVDVHMSSNDMLAELPSLADGEAWIWSPGALDVFRKFKFRRRHTFDSGETPKVGAPRRQPTRLADIDLAAVQEAMSATIERQKANDPDELRRRIRDLEKQIKDSPSRVEYVDVVREVVPASIIKFLEVGGKAATELSNAFIGMCNGSPIAQSAIRIPESNTAPKVRDSTPTLAKVQVSAPKVAPSPRVTSSVAPAGEWHGFGKTERAVLTVLIQHGPLSIVQIAMFTGYSAKASTVPAALTKLRRAGLVEGNPVRATQTALDFYASHVEALPSGPALLEYWRTRFGITEQRVLDALLAGDDNVRAIAERTGYSPTASTIPAAMTILRRAGVVDRWALSDEFLQAIG